MMRRYEKKRWGWGGGEGGQGSLASVGTVQFSARLSVSVN
jgi:hypothetical protein